MRRRVRFAVAVRQRTFVGNEVRFDKAASSPGDDRAEYGANEDSCLRGALSQAMTDDTPPVLRVP